MGDLHTNGESSSGTTDPTKSVKIPRSSFAGSDVRTPFFPNGSSENLSLSEKDSALAEQIKKAHSLHGAVAAKRQATTELLFFASVGDVSRIKRICDTWGIVVRSSF